MGRTIERNGAHDGKEKHCGGRGRVHTARKADEGREQGPLQSEATRSVRVEGTVPVCTADCILKASSWDGARCGPRPGGVKLGNLGSAASGRKLNSPFPDSDVSDVAGHPTAFKANWLS